MLDSSVVWEIPLKRPSVSIVKVYEYIKYRLTQPCLLRINNMTTIVSASQGHHQVKI
jgi:hypothetical protein